MSTLYNDLKFGIRQLAKNPGFTFLVILTLGLGIGANTALFSLLDRILLRSIPLKNLNKLVKLEYQYEPGGMTNDRFNYPLYTSYRNQSQVFSELIAYTTGMNRPYLWVGERAEEVFQMSVSSNYFSVLGIQPIMGRTFYPEEERGQGFQPGAVISHRVWSRLFNSDPAVLGKTLRLNNCALTVIGVLSPEFTGTMAGINPAVYTTLGTLERTEEYSLDSRSHQYLTLLGRLRSGVSRAQAQAQLRVVAERIHRLTPTNTYPHVLVSDARVDSFWGGEGAWLIVLMLQTPTLLILLVACANVANILLARGMIRQREIAIRRALGADRLAVIRQLLIESFILALLSGACGAFLAHWLSFPLLTALPAIQRLDVPGGVDGRILGFTLLGSLGSVFLFGLVPALQVSRPNVMAVLKENAGAFTLFSRRFCLRNLLVVVQVAVSVIVLSFGVVCLLSLRALRVDDPGFDTKSVLSVSIDLKYVPPGKMDVSDLFADLQKRVVSLPCVRSVSLSSGLPLSGKGWMRTGVEYIEDFQVPAQGPTPHWDYTMVSPGYFQTLGIPLLRGRDFTPQDGPGTPKVMIVNELLAQHFWPDQDPIGKHVSFGEDGIREVIGLVTTTKILNMRKKPVPLSFYPIAQQTGIDSKIVPLVFEPCLLIRTQGDFQSLLSFLRKELQSTGLIPGTYQVSTLAKQTSELLDVQRAITGFLSVIGVVGLLFVGTGIAGVAAYEVNQRTREIGIRMALGAQRQHVLYCVLRKGALLTGTGLALGLGLSCVPLWILTRLLPDVRLFDETVLYGVHMWDPVTYLSVTLLISGIMLGASWFPARRAAKIDPMEALRYE